MSLSIRYSFITVNMTSRQGTVSHWSWSFWHYSSLLQLTDAHFSLLPHQCKQRFQECRVFQVITWKMISIYNFFPECFIQALSCCIGALKGQVDDKQFSIPVLLFWVRKIVRCSPSYLLFLSYSQSIRSSYLVCVSCTATFHSVNFLLNWVTWV